ncbi:MAG: helix-turn-helix domain-containing protein [Erysipelotrichaceae bacterium]|nr:helix-turn-helix domain-containing protein [Erysipelotrichaceae bacterium]
MNKLPEKLVKLRKHYNYSQSYLADTLGVDTFEYMNYENGSKMINYVQMKKLASLYHLSVMDIFKNDDEVTLMTLDNTTDEINLEYFTKELTWFDKAKAYISSHKLVSGIIGGLVLTIIVLLIVLSNMARPYTPVKLNINRLSVSETTVVYIDENDRVQGAGSNTNGELSNMDYTSPIKVCEGEGFTLILNEDGTVNYMGSLDSMAKSCASLRNIVDIAAGSSFYVAVDSNGRVFCEGDDAACQISSTRNIQRVFASRNASIVEDNDGNLSFAGTIIGSSSLKNYKNIITMDSSDELMAILKDDGTINVFSKSNRNYLVAESWNDIVDVAVGNDFVAGLDSYGKVHIEIENDEISDEVAGWSDIIAIDAGSDYLIGFNGKMIVGVGNNAYHQFVKEENTKTTLEKVTSITYMITGNSVDVSFNGVDNASGYLVSLDVGTGLSKRIEKEEIVSFDSEAMREGKNYTISITSIGTGSYKDSDVATLSFTFYRPSATIELDDRLYINKEIDTFMEYMVSMGFKEENIIGKPGDEDDICGGNVVTVSSTSVDGKTLNADEVGDIVIEYTYCKVLE